MDINTYSALAMRTANTDNPVMNALLGIAGESGEVCDYMKKCIFHDKTFDVDVVAAEIGDLCWYINLLVVSMGLTWEDILEMNIAKLEARYPDLRFDPERANNRDVAAEQAAMAR